MAVNNNPLNFRSPITKFVATLYSTFGSFLNDPTTIMYASFSSSFLQNIFTKSFMATFFGGLGGGIMIQHSVLKDTFYTKFELKDNWVKNIAYNWLGLGEISDFILESIKFVNLKTIDAPVTLYLANATTAVPKAYLAFNMIVPGTSSLEILQSAKLLKFGDALYARYANSSNADSIAVFTSYRKADATSLSSTTPSVSSTDTASIVFNTTISEGTTLYYTIE